MCSGKNGVTSTMKKPLSFFAFQFTKLLFPRRNIKISALSAVMHALFLSIMLAAALNTLSAGAEVAGIDKMRSASFQTFGNLVRLFCHHSKGSK